MKLRRRGMHEDAVFESVCLLGTLALLGGLLGSSMNLERAGFLVGLAVGGVFLVWRP